MRASRSASISTPPATASEENPIARSVAISTLLAATAEYIELSALNSAPSAMIEPMEYPTSRSIRLTDSDAVARYSGSLRASEYRLRAAFHGVPECRELAR